MHYRVDQEQTGQMIELESPQLRALQATIAGRYSVECELGRGAMGIVYLARDIALERPVAIKLLPQEQDFPRLRDRFLREARTAANLVHPNIVPIHAVEEHEDLVFYVMAFVEGETLRERVERAGPLPVSEAVRVIQEVSWALGYAHGRAVVHRDIKPENIMIERTTHRALVMDFGIARILDADTLTTDGVVVGTPNYMSPEQAAGSSVDPRSDLYSLGATAFYALTGRVPFEERSVEALLASHISKPAPPVAGLRSDIPAVLARVVDRCLLKEPGRRFESADEVAQVLENLGRTGLEIPPVVHRYVAEVERLAVEVPLYGLVFLIALALLPSFWWTSTALVLSLLTLERARQAIQACRFVAGSGYAFEDAREALLARAEGHDRELAVTGRWSDLFSSLQRNPIYLVLVWAIAGSLTPADYRSSYRDPSVTYRARPTKRSAHGAWTRLWAGRFGRWTFRLCSRGIEQRARSVLTHQRTEILLGNACLTIFNSLATRYRERLLDVPQLVKRLQAGVRALRQREAEVAQALAEAGMNPMHRVTTTVGQSAKSAETTLAAALAERRVLGLASLEALQKELQRSVTTTIAALENLKLDLIRLRAGAASLEDLGEALRTVMEIGRDVDALLAGEVEVSRLVDPTLDPTIAEDWRLKTS